MGTVKADGAKLECVHLPGRRGGPTLVFLHEGLGSVALWKSFPAAVARRTGLPAVVYSRRGHGGSERLAAPHPPDFMHHEAKVVLPALLDALGIDAPILVGHSDGASIALLYAGSEGHRAEGLVLMAPHLFVEDLTIRSIEAARESFEQTDLRQRLGRYHDDPEHTFRAWNDVWLSPGFRSFDIRSYVPAVTVPMLAIQGRDDEYGTAAQHETLAREARSRVDVLVLGGCGHSPHRDREQTTREAIAAFAEGP